ncbi:hypothetical protein RB653_003121 [Dictyostelium firmibasis]|uniref:Follistatin-like domain-containing protein n=1 Tax=Dictyostelium firmibasis TaxID=79012 RepID=A0AAN7TZ29_9MYCE
MRLYLLSLILVFYASASWAAVDNVEYGGGWGSGNQGVLCGTHYCPPGSTCESKHGHYICRPNGLITAPSGGDSGGIWTGGDKHKKDCGGTGCCKDGQYCAKLDGRERCVYYPDDKGPQCGGSFCREGQICVLDHGVLGCLDNPVADSQANCGLFHCNYNEYCIMVNGYLQCLFSNGTAPFSCGLETCVPPQLCVKVENCSQCVAPPKPDNNCGDRYCDEEHQCVRVGAGYGCIPKRLTCDVKKCETGKTCIMVNGDAQCIVPPSVISPLRRNAVPINRNVKPTQHNSAQQHAKPAAKPAQHAAQQQQHAKPAAKPVQHNAAQQHAAQQQHAKPAQHTVQQQHAKPAAKPVQHNAAQQHAAQQQHAKPAAKPVQHNAAQQHAKPAAKPVQHNAAQQHAKPAAKPAQHAAQQAKPAAKPVQHNAAQQQQANKLNNAQKQQQQHQRQEVQARQQARIRQNAANQAAQKKATASKSQAKRPASQKRN